MTQQSKSPLHRVAFVAGLGHSGTTYLEILLCSAEATLGLGEIGLYIKRLKEGRAVHPECSCGNSATDCTFWGGLARLAESSDPIAEVFQKASDQFEGALIIDSSKAYETFQKYYFDKRPDTEVRVIFLVRDFRSWALSRTRNAKRKSKLNLGILIEAYRWLLLNIRMERTIKKSGLKNVTVVYENLVFAQPKEMNRIFDFLDLKATFNSSLIGKGQVHDIYGNRMKDDPEKLKTIHYDSRWMSSMTLMVLWPLLLPQLIYMSRIRAKSS